jgi:hypothetical protein
MDDGINLTDVLALITILEPALEDSDYIAMVRRKLKVLKHTS